MTAQFARGPQPRVTSQPPNAPHAALLIDFDNVTMGIRSDLTKELKSLLNSDIIKGKVAVQRAYADWRRYPQYIVPLAENSVDLIFAPAYGSSKKNATDIRLAIDALELVFTRAEIGTFILLSGDSDFSSLVLKLKEYGKYVIGVGIRESSSDLLVQNCDEYYSYSGLTGLTRAGEETPRETFDPWELVEIGVRQMAEQKDVMRSDRLKQILLELDPNFDEKSLGFPKFNRFLQEAAVRGQLQLRKMENGQFEVAPVEPGSIPEPAPRPAPRRGRGRRGAPAETHRVAEPAPATVSAPIELPAPLPVAEPAPPVAPPVAPPAEAEAPAASSGELREAYELLQRAAGDLTRGKGGPVRDSDVKRRMLELVPGFDEGAYGFSKFSRFLRQAHDAEVINLNKVENGSYEVTLANQGGSQRAPDAGRGPSRPRSSVTPDSSDLNAPAPDSMGGDNGDRARRGRGRDRHEHRERGREERGRERGRERPARADEAPAPRAQRPPVAEPIKPTPSAATKPSVALGFRRGSRRGGPAPAAPPPILAGQSVAPAATTEPVQAETPPALRPAKAERAAKKPVRHRQATEDVQSATPTQNLPLDQLALPRDEAEIVDRLASYKGVGRKSAEAMVQAFGPDVVFRVLHEQPDRVRQMLGGRRAEQVLRGWQHDYAMLCGADADRKSGPARKQKRTNDEPTVATTERGAAPTAGKRGRSGNRPSKEPDAASPSDGQ